MTRPLVIFGLEDVAQVVACYFDAGDQYRVVAFSADATYITADTVLGRPVVPWEQLATTYPPESHELFVAVSYGDFNRTRARLVKRAKDAGYRLANYISRLATVIGAELGDNLLIAENVSVQPFAMIGDGTFLWPHTVIAHHTAVGACGYIGPHVFVGGHAVVGDGCIIGPHATVASFRRIGRNGFIGAGARVFANLAEETIVLEPGSRPAAYTTSTVPKAVSDKLFNIG